MADRKALARSRVRAGGVFSSAGAGVKTNLVFFNKGKSTEKIWYYDLSDVKVGKKTFTHRTRGGAGR